MKNNLLVVILISSVVALIIAPTSVFLFNSYADFNGQSLNFGGELNLNSYGYMSPNFIIQEPRKVVVNQDLKVEETIISLKTSLFGVYLKSEDSEAAYNINNPFAQALAATTDGWVMATWPQVLKLDKLDSLINDYIVIDGNKKIYEIEQVEAFPETGATFVFLKLKDASGLNIRRMLDDSEIKLGQSILLASQDGSFSLDYLSDKTIESAILASDSYPYKLVLNSAAAKKPLFAFNLSGEMIGALDANGAWLSSVEINAYWRSLFKSKILTRPSLALNYINLSDYINPSWPEKGALIESFYENIDPSDNPAMQAGLEIGDIITKVNGTEVGVENNLSVLINLYNPQDSIFIHYLRDGMESEIVLILGSI